VIDDSFHLLDTTLRDGAQRAGINLTVADKLTIARHLDDFGVGFIEGGCPGAGPRDTEFFVRAATELDLRQAQLVAFGSTRRPGTPVAGDPLVAALLDSAAPVVTLAVASHHRHVELALRTTLEENLAMVHDTVAYLRAHGRRVFVDCEHFFDGHRSQPGYAVQVVHVAHQAGAEVVVLCDTNGGMLPAQVQAIVADVRQQSSARLGIRAHDDGGCAVANTLAAVDAGATHVQCTANGYGERVGNANLFAVVGALELIYDRRVLPVDKLAEMTRISHAIAEAVDLPPCGHQPYVGASAFAHTADRYPCATGVDPDLYRHADPALVGNTACREAGHACQQFGQEQPGEDLSSNRDLLGQVDERVGRRGPVGSSCHAPDASLEPLPRAGTRGWSPRHFELESYRVSTEQRSDGVQSSEAMAKIRINGERVVAAAEGNGPVDALDRALRTALEPFYPQVARLQLVDYKVRILQGNVGTGAVARVHVSMGDEDARWATVGVGEDVIAASWQALDDAYTYGLSRMEGASPDACLLVVRMRGGRGTLARIASTLNNYSVLALSYLPTEQGLATAKIQVRVHEAARVRAKLRRMVDVVDVTHAPATR
jgi:2-isopropylmalate synthase